MTNQNPTTCENCHRPIASDNAEWHTRWKADGHPHVGYFCGCWHKGQHDRDEGCSYARNRWQVAEIERLTVRTATLESKIATLQDALVNAAIDKQQLQTALDAAYAEIRFQLSHNCFVSDRQCAVKALWAGGPEYATAAILISKDLSKPNEGTNNG